MEATTGYCRLDLVCLRSVGRVRWRAAYRGAWSRSAILASVVGGFDLSAHLFWGSARGLELLVKVLELMCGLVIERLRFLRRVGVRPPRSGSAETMALIASSKLSGCSDDRRAYFLAWQHPQRQSVLTASVHRESASLDTVWSCAIILKLRSAASPAAPLRGFFFGRRASANGAQKWLKMRHRKIIVRSHFRQHFQGIYFFSH